jgi:hypothetical protein
MQLTNRIRPPTPGLRYSEDPDRSRGKSGSSEYLRPGVGGHPGDLTRIERETL